MNIFDLVNEYEEKLGMIIKSFGCVNYNLVIQEIQEYKQISTWYIFRSSIDKYPNRIYTPYRLLKIIRWSKEISNSKLFNC